MPPRKRHFYSQNSLLDPARPLGVARLQHVGSAWAVANAWVMGGATGLDSETPVPGMHSRNRFSNL